jgi:hypothetical protein
MKINVSYNNWNDSASQVTKLVVNGDQVTIQIDASNEYRFESDYGCNEIKKKTSAAKAALGTYKNYIEQNKKYQNFNETESLDILAAINTEIDKLQNDYNSAEKFLELNKSVINFHRAAKSCNVM